MEFKKRNRMYPVDVLKIDYEYCTISYYAEGERNDLGEPSRVLLQRADNVKCSIDPITRIPSHIDQTGLRDILKQGIIERSAYIMTLSSNQVIESEDIITDYDNVKYDVLQIINFHTHKEAYLKSVISN